MRLLAASIAFIVSMTSVVALSYGSTSVTRVGMTGDAARLTTAGWSVELVAPHGGSASPSLGLNSSDSPSILFCPPGEARYAVRGKAGWSDELVVQTIFGGICGDLAIGDDDVPHIYTPTAKDVLKPLYGVRNGSIWTLSPTTVGGDYEIDRTGILHAVQVDPRPPVTIQYATLLNISPSGTTWHIETVETAGSNQSASTVWASLAYDLSNLPHVLHYNDLGGQVRHAYRQDDGTWHAEIVGTAGDIFQVGRQGSLAIDSKGPRAAFVVRSADGNRHLMYANLSGGLWTSELVDSSDFAIFPSLASDKEGNVRLLYERINRVATSPPTYDDDLIYATRTPSGWTYETTYDGHVYINSPSDPWDDDWDSPTFPSMALDSCGNPHAAIYLSWRQGHDDSRKGVYYATKGEPCSRNRPPVVNGGGHYMGHEGSSLTLAATATDPDSDPLAYRWDLDNDGIADTSWSSSPAISHTWPDDYTGTVRVEVSDNKTTVNATATVIILNLPPRIDSIHIPAITATAKLRIAGEKWHDISAYIVDGGNETLMTTLTRQPGKPQEASFPVTIDVTRPKSIRVVYTPEDDRVNGNRNGASPAWLTFTFDGRGEETFHHTFNVKHPETWNWTVGLNQLLAGREIEFEATATDPGSDNLTFEWEWGDGTPATVSTFLNGGTFPFTATDEETHSFATAGTYDLKVSVRDDDGGVNELNVTLTIE